MNRTSILLPPDLKHRAERHARRLGISLGELIRRSLAETLGACEVRDPLFDDDAVHGGDAPPDASARHDDYLHGRES